MNMFANKFYLMQLRACRAAASFIDGHPWLVRLVIYAYTLVMGVYALF